MCMCLAVIVGREITMSALREWAATLGPAAREAVAVNAWGKWKTATQVITALQQQQLPDGVYILHQSRMYCCSIP